MINPKDRIGKNCHIVGNVCIGNKNKAIEEVPVIGDNCIVGADSVVRGILESGYIYCGNPCKKLCSVEHFAEKYKYLRV